MRSIIPAILGALLLAAPVRAAGVVGAHALFDPALPAETCVGAAASAVNGAGLQFQSQSANSVNATNPAGDSFMITCVAERGVVYISAATAGDPQRLVPLLRRLLTIFGGG